MFLEEKYVPILLFSREHCVISRVLVEEFVSSVGVQYKHFSIYSKYDTLTAGMTLSQDPSVSVTLERAFSPKHIGAIGLQLSRYSEPTLSLSSYRVLTPSCVVSFWFSLFYSTRRSTQRVWAVLRLHRKQCSTSCLFPSVLRNV